MNNFLDAIGIILLGGVFGFLMAWGMLGNSFLNFLK